MSQGTYIFEGGNSGVGTCVPCAVPAYGGGYGGFGGGWGGDGIWAILLAALWGGRGFGGFGGEGGGANLVATEANTNLLMQGLNGNADAIRSLASQLNVDDNALEAAVCSVKDKIGNLECTMAINNGNTIHAVDSAARDISSEIAACCCNTQNAITRMGYEDQLAVLNQTNTLTNTINAGNAAIACKLDAINQNINDKFCQQQIAQLQRDVDHYRTANQDLRFQISQDRQSAFLYSAITGSNAGTTTA